LPQPSLLPSSIGGDRRVSLSELTDHAFAHRFPCKEAGHRQEISMSDNYIIEIRPKPKGHTVQAGIVVRDGREFRFFAAADAFYALERQLFKNPKDAEKAALRTAATDHDAEAPHQSTF
jgi:hypothetical protein